MAIERQGRKPCRLLILAVLVLGGAWAALMPWLAGLAATTEYVITDRHSGLAISGFDPVAYFVNRAPRLGKGEYEYRHAGAVWRFRNEGNRAAFAADPDIYAPAYGGYDPVDVARGTAVAGDPRLWLVTGQRLYLFYTAEHRSAFAGKPDGIIGAANKQWPAVQLTLSP
jgi:hypothetical protein